MGSLNQMSFHTTDYRHIGVNSEPKSVPKTRKVNTLVFTFCKETHIFSQLPKNMCDKLAMAPPVTFNVGFTFTAVKSEEVHPPFAFTRIKPVQLPRKDFPVMYEEVDVQTLDHIASGFLPQPLRNISSANIHDSLINSDVELDGNKNTREGFLHREVTIPFVRGEQVDYFFVSFLWAVPLAVDGTLGEHSLEQAHLVAASHGERNAVGGISLADKNNDGRTDIEFTFKDYQTGGSTVMQAMTVNRSQERHDGLIDYHLITSAALLAHHLDSAQKLCETFALADQTFTSLALAMRKDEAKIWFELFSPLISGLQSLDLRHRTGSLKLDGRERDRLHVTLQRANRYFLVTPEHYQQFFDLTGLMLQLAEKNALSLPPGVKDYAKESNPQKRRALYEAYLDHHVVLWENQLSPIIDDLNQMARDEGFVNFADYNIQKRFNMPAGEFVARFMHYLEKPDIQKTLQDFALWLGSIKKQLEPQAKAPVALADVDYLYNAGVLKEAGVTEPPRITVDQARTLVTTLVKNELGIDLTKPPFDKIIWDLKPREGKLKSLGTYKTVSASHGYFAINVETTNGLVTLNDVKIMLHEILHGIHSQWASLRDPEIIMIKDLENVYPDVTEGLARTVEGLMFDEARIKPYLQKAGFSDAYIHAFCTRGRMHHVWSNARGFFKAEAEINLYARADLPLAERVKSWKENVRKYLQVEPEQSPLGEYVFLHHLTSPQHMFYYGSYGYGFSQFDPQLQKLGPKDFMKKMLPFLKGGALVKRQTLPPSP